MVMVLEQMFKIKWIESKGHAFFLGLIYTIVGLISAKLIFPASLGIMSMAFTSILLIPSLAKLLQMEENVEIREKKLNLKQLFKDHKDIFKVYTFLFLGIFLAYALVALFSSTAGIQYYFSSQMKTVNMVGNAFNSTTFFSIVKNNLVVFIASLILSFVYGAGAVIFLTWNASVWGVVFGFFAKYSAANAQINPILYFFTSIWPFVPHLVTEALAYIGAAIVGGIVSKAVLREELFSKKFHHIVTDALIFLTISFILVIIAAAIEVSII